MTAGILRSNTRLVTLLPWYALAGDHCSSQTICIFPHNYPFFSFFLTEPWLATAGTGKEICIYSGIAPQLPWLVTAAQIEETSSLVKPWPATAGTAILVCAIFHTKIYFTITSSTSGYEDRRTTSAFLSLRSRQIPTALLLPSSGQSSSSPVPASEWIKVAQKRIFLKEVEFTHKGHICP